MIEVRAYQPGDLDRIERQPRQRPEAAMMQPGTPDAGPSFTALRGDVPILVAGLAEWHGGYASAWAVIAADLRGDYVAVARAIRRVLDACRYTRVDTLVREEWARAHDLALLLGFEKESVMRRMGAEGEDVAVYARIRPSAAGGTR